MASSYSPLDKGKESEDSDLTVGLMEQETGPYECTRRSRWEQVKMMARNPLIIANVVFFLVSLRGYWLWWAHDMNDHPKTNDLLKSSSYYCKILGSLKPPQSCD